MFIKDDNGEIMWALSIMMMVLYLFMGMCFYGVYGCQQKASDHSLWYRAGKVEVYCDNGYNGEVYVWNHTTTSAAYFTDMKEQRVELPVKTNVLGWQIALDCVIVVLDSYSKPEEED